MTSRASRPPAVREASPGSTWATVNGAGGHAGRPLGPGAATIVEDAPTSISGVQAAARSHDRMVEACERRRELAEEAWRAAVAARRHLTLSPAIASSRQRRAVAEERVQAAADRYAAAVDRLAAALMLRRACVDGMTGALSRDVGMDVLLQEVHRAERQGTALSVLFLDVDGLKAVNDSGGHAAGDAVLRSVGNAVRATVRDYDVFVRFGGDEFIVALPTASADDAEARAQQLRQHLGALVPPVQLSAGVARRRQGEALEALLRRADADLYRRRDAYRAVPVQPRQADADPREGARRSPP